MELLYGIITAFVIFGGVRKIADITSKLVPLMAGLYFLMCSYIILKNNYIIPQIFKDIINSAFNIKAFGFGTITTLLIGMQKGIFSSELGLGTGSIAAAISDNKYPASNRSCSNIWNSF